jgi:hypothetical protein
MLVKNHLKRSDSNSLISSLNLIDKITENETITYYVNNNCLLSNK